MKTEIQTLLVERLTALISTQESQIVDLKSSFNANTQALVASFRASEAQFLSVQQAQSKQIAVLCKGLLALTEQVKQLTEICQE